jgi:hypothetical protein
MVLATAAHGQSLEAVANWNRILIESVVLPGANPPTVFVHRGKHIAYKERVDHVQACILQGGEGRVPAQLTQGQVPVLVDFYLSDSKNCNLSHCFTSLQF